MPGEKKDNKRLYIMLGVLGVLVLVGGFMFLRGRSGGGGSAPAAQVPQTGLATRSAEGDTVATPAGAIGGDTASRRSAELVALLNSVKTISLSDEIFQNPAFGMLEDISSRLPEDRNRGRSNPFFPIGVEQRNAEFDLLLSGDNSIIGEPSDEQEENLPVATGDSAIDQFLQGGVQ